MADIKIKNASQRDIQAAEHREKLLTVGYELICKYGIDGVGVREISEAAGVTTGTFYHNFKSKQDLLWNYAGSRKEFGRGFEELSEGSAVSRIMAFFTGAVADVLEKDGHELVMWILTKKETSSPLYDATYRLVCEGIANKEFSDEKPPEELTDYILDCYRGAAFAWFRSEGKKDIRTLIQEHVGYGLEHFLSK